MRGVRGDQEEGLGRACTTLTSPGGCDKTGMEPFSGREIWAPANVNALEELMHSMLICNASASWSHVWETGRVCEQIPNTLQVPRKLRHGGKSHSCRGAEVERSLLSLFSLVEESWDGNQQYI